MSVEPEPGASRRLFFIATAPARAALVPLEHGLGARAPFVLLTGDAGTGRSMLAREALRRRGDRISPILFPDPAPPPAELLATLLVPFGGGPPKPGAMAFALTERLMDTLANVTTAGRVAVALIDDAERLTDEHFLELHRITSIAAQRQCPFELLLVGGPKLPDRFDAPHMALVRQRISVRSALTRFSPNDTREYLQSRLNAAGVPCTGMFSRKASRDIHQITVGTVRLIEALAAESLRRAARAGQATVSPEHVRAADHALRTGRPSEESGAPVLSQVRASAVDMAANTRSVPSVAEPRHAPSQGTRPMGHSAKPESPAKQAAPAPMPAAATPVANKPYNAAVPEHVAEPQPQHARHDKRSRTSRPDKRAQANAAANAKPANAAPPVVPASTAAPLAPTQASTPSSAPSSAPPRSSTAARAAAANAIRPASSTPSATHARPMSMPAHDPGSIGAYPGSDDPRVQEWLARFGGKGVRVGSAPPTIYSPQEYSDFGSNRMADADGVVTPARPIRREATPAATPATPVATPATPATQVTPAGTDSGASSSPAIPPDAAQARETAAAPVASARPNSAPAPRRAPEPVVEAPRVAKIEHHSARKRSVSKQSAPTGRASDPAPTSPRSAANNSALVAVVVLAAVVAIGFSQRQMLRGMFSQALTVSTSSKVATTVSAPLPVPQLPPTPSAPPAQYAIAVGSYPTRDMANAECEYLTRLVPVHVRVNAPGGNRNFRLLLGRFDERAEAEMAIKQLQDRGLIPDARVLEITPVPAAASTVMESMGTSAPDSAPTLLLEPTATQARASSPQKPSRAKSSRRR